LTDRRARVRSTSRSGALEPSNTVTPGALQPNPHEASGSPLLVEYLDLRALEANLVPRPQEPPEA